MTRDIATFTLTALAGLALLANVTRAEDSLDDLQEKAIKAAVKKASASVVKIETSGGTDFVVGGGGPGGPGGPRLILKGAGPTTVAPFRREHHQIQRVRRLHLEPALSPPARLVRSVK